MIKEPLLRDIHPEGRAESNLLLPGTVQVVEIEIVDWEGAAQRRQLPDLSAGHGVDRGDHLAGAPDTYPKRQRTPDKARKRARRESEICRFE